MPDPTAMPKETLAYWFRRVFRNSYTRRGRLIRVRGWAVKIQHRGRRRTFSLGTVPRREAARRAQAIYRAIATRGWDAAVGSDGLRAVPASDAASKATAAYWRRRLLARRYTEGLRPHLAGELSAWIEHDGEGHYIPLGTTDRTQAARRAAEIYRSVAAAGWPAAKQRFAREITVAVFWAMDPLACTYTTLFTQPLGDDTGPHGGAGRRRAGLVCVVEADAGVRGALASCVAMQPEGWRVTTLATAGDALRSGPHLGASLLLLNRDLPGVGGGECAQRLRARHPDLAVFTYGVYDDSDQLFLSFGGVPAGYILKRRPPGLLLEPVASLGPATPLRRHQVARAVRRYFQGLFDAPSPREAQLLARLTPREQEILEHLSRGQGDKEIAQRLGISAWTVHGHLRSIFGKLQVHTRTEAAVRYLQK
ncbi:MAG: response regulator transcription factor [Armatimonadota bacterium]|nr:response regulator transcription factor [Armatimonadota bacterium]MDR7548808.1 response regulator transcription factor [Armatimonadota bacterium]